MIIKLTKKLVSKFPPDSFRKWGVSNPKDWSWREEYDLDLTRFLPAKIDELLELLNTHPKILGVGVLIRDINTWKRALNDASDIRARTIYQFSFLLTEMLRTVPGHRLYAKFGETSETQAWLAFYVNRVEYRPEQTSRDSRHPAHVIIYLLYQEFNGTFSKSVSFYADDVRCSITEALARKGFYAETPEFRATYELETQRFSRIHSQIGKQFYAVGTGTTNLDGNPSDDSWGRNLNKTVQLGKDAQPTRCVVDVFYEDDSTSRRHEKEHISVDFWKRKRPLIESFSGDDDIDDEEIDHGEQEDDFIEIPVHPLCAVFDLSRHLRLRVHVNYLTEYVYDRNLSDKLVLSADLKNLVMMLMNHNALLFKDIIKGKSGGVVILLTGKPGTGKTLTAEVYAESEGRALYSVQCSQLGTDPDELEAELLKAFARARRWNAVMLLDEADVYVHDRGTDMRQNAIVGVFLRVLEYHASVLFLTTNRPEDVDDAIASRCIARLSYSVPSPEDQTRIWKILIEQSKINMSDNTVDVVVKNSPGLSGRDVKNLLKLGHMYAGEDRAVTSEMIEFVKKFKPTA